MNTAYKFLFQIDLKFYLQIYSFYLCKFIQVQDFQAKWEGFMAGDLLFCQIEGDNVMLVNISMNISCMMQRKRR